MYKKSAFIMLMLICAICVSHVDINASMQQGDKEITHIYFGNYWQTDGTKKEPIEWNLGGIQGNVASLESSRILEYMIYDDTWSKDSTWATSKCRHWLNNEFYNSAFDKNEKGQIIKKLPGGYRQQDFSTIYLSGCYEDIPIKATNYALRKHPDIGPLVWWVVDISFSFETEGRKCAYSTMDNLRAGMGRYVGYLGQYQGNTLIIRNELFGMRPSIYIDISKDGWKPARYRRKNMETGKYEYYKIEYASKEDKVGVETIDTELKKDYLELAKEDVWTVKLKYQIKKPSIKITKKSRTKATIQWKKTDNATSYDLWYSTSKKFAKKKTKKLQLTGTKYTIRKIKKKKKYYVKVRGKLKVDRISANGKWSKVRVYKRK
ncbi:DUF6273 domain-containing protein [Eubacterium xylanophilum]|uniref:DUF6273 domain-containing protein n=1 Tax=Eubacterium xylanophilum TaxID=39497 RepID=UPI00047CD2E6|nr:DUF6273 domain-containing protein [Eubacterium xylanophilum]